MGVVPMCIGKRFSKMNKRVKEILLVTGACRSGKSRFAQEWADTFPPKRVFLATAQALDAEMAERVRRHRETRGAGWVTREEPQEVAAMIRNPGEDVTVVLLDCVTLWLNNLLMAGLPDTEILDRANSLTNALREAPCPVAVVTNEVGWGIVPEHLLGRRFRDLEGSVNQGLAQAADRVVLMVAGLPVSLK
jgi:adenosylcobinamide kinase/adenosylcobinamide-phosphate guanylyltransferase